MEHAPLRPVPARPAGTIDPVAATSAVAAWLPALPPEAVEALALVGLSERPRAEAAGSLNVSEQELGELLAAARKELRQTLATLGGSGWCERAEGLISDRLDGALAAGDVRRLDVHLRNCARCVEHERRLVQATDVLVAELGGVAGGGGGAAAPLGEAPQEVPEEVPPVEAPPEELPSAEDVPEELPPAGSTDELPPGDAVAELPPADGALKEVPSDGDALPAEIVAPAPAPSDAEIAAAAEVLVAVRTRRQIAAAITWNALIALAILLAVATIAISVAGILGAEL